MNKYFIRMILFSGSYYTRLFYNSVGAWRLRQILLPLLRKHGKQFGTQVIDSRHGFKINANLEDWLGQYVYITGEYEPPTTQLIKRLLPKNGVFLDIGANVGYFSLLACSIVGKGGQVIAFEPIPIARKHLHNNIDLNNGFSIIIENKAVSNNNGLVEIYEGPDSHKGISSIRPISNAKQKINVETIRIDDYLSDYDRLDIVKIDVEGAEALVIEGMKNTITKLRPHIILEATDEFLQSFDSSTTSLSKSIMELGYEMFIIRNDTLEQVSSFPDEWENQFNAYFRPLE